MENTCKDVAAYSMSFSKEELEVLDTALRDSLGTSMERMSECIHNRSAKSILDRVKDELLNASQLLMRVAYVLEIAYDAEAAEEEED